MKILVLTKLNAAQKNQLKEGINGQNDLVFKDDLTEELLIKNLNEIAIILGNIPIKHLSHPMLKLKFWQLDSAGFDQYQHIDLPIPVANMGTFYAKRCAEKLAV